MSRKRQDPRVCLILFHRKASLMQTWWVANLAVVTRNIRTRRGRPNKTLILRRGTRRILLALCVVSRAT
jgi:hypothetical protein